MKLLPPAITLGAMATGVRFPHRSYRRRPQTVTGKVDKVLATKVRLKTEAGYFLVERIGAKEVSR